MNESFYYATTLTYIHIILGLELIKGLIKIVNNPSYQYIRWSIRYSKQKARGYKLQEKEELP